MEEIKFTPQELLCEKFGIPVDELSSFIEELEEELLDHVEPTKYRHRAPIKKVKGNVKGITTRIVGGAEMILLNIKMLNVMHK